MALAGGGFQATDLLLGGLQPAGQVFLGESRPLPERGELESDIPSVTRLFKLFGEGLISQLLIEVEVKIGCFHPILARTEDKPNRVG